MTEQPQVGWGVIGAAGIAKRRMIPEGIVPAANARLAVSMDVNEEAGRAVADEFGGRFTVSVDDLLADDNVQAVYVGTPNHLHCDQVIACAQASKHVLCEKPLALTTEQCQAMIEACRAADVLLSVDFMMRFNVYHRHIRQLIQGGRLGIPTHARGQMTSWHPPGPAHWRHSPEQGGGGAVMDVAGHIVDVMELFFGRTKSVFCQTFTHVHDTPVEDTGLMQVTFESGVAAMIDMSMGVPSLANEYVLEVYGSKGAIKCQYTLAQLPGGNVRACLMDELGDFKKQEAARYKGGAYSPIELEAKSNYGAHVEAMSQAILNGGLAPVPGEDGLWNHLVVQAAYESARTGVPVEPKLPG